MARVKLAYLVDLREARHLWTVQHTQCQADHLQILTSSCRGDVARLRANVVDNSSLQPRNQEVCALVDDLLLHTRQTIEDDSSSSPANIVNRLVDEKCTECHGTGEAVHILQYLCHDVVEGGGKES